ncbi:MAG: restriction endonuclease [Verrucomicrobiota bacterium]
MYLIGGFYTLCAIIWAIDRIKNIPLDIKEKERIERLEKETQRRETILASEQARFEELKIESKIALETISKEKALGFPWLATAYSDYLKLFELKLANELENKKHPAKRAAEEIRAMSSDKADLRRENRILRELHRYYENLFPWLIDFKGEDLDELIRQVNRPKSEENEDPVAEWLSDAEYNSPKLSRAEKSQRALDRYWQSKKSPWQLGRDYERYIGYIHERDGFKVEYHGIELGYEDLGRDLICRKSNEVRIVQCKHWSAQKTMHEKHVCQIYGTATAYNKMLEKAGDLFGIASVKPWLYISCAASPTAKEFAYVLGVTLIDTFPLAKYPTIKCNVSLRDGTKIYHLPFDQQYDRTLIEYKDECYVETVAEAESLGFRRAFRWRGTNPQADTFITA